jgi:hypothetical protein
LGVITTQALPKILLKAEKGFLKIKGYDYFNIIIQYNTNLPYRYRYVIMNNTVPEHNGKNTTKAAKGIKQRKLRTNRITLEFIFEMIS